MHDSAADATGAAPVKTPTPRPLGGRYAWYTLAILMTVYIINVIDRQILSILAQDIKGDLHITDADLGFLYGTAFAIFFSLFGIPFGRLADLWYRGRLIAIGLAFWSSMTALSGFAQSYGMLTLGRMGVAIGESSATPAAWSMLGDLFPKNRRALVNALYASASIIGGSLSLPIGGWIAASWNRSYPVGTAPLGLLGWQAAFLAVGAPGLLLAVLVFMLREPLRGASDGTFEAPVQPGAWRIFGLELAAIVPPLTLWSVAHIPGGLKTNLMVLAGIVGAAAVLIVATGDTAQWVAYGVGIYAVSSWVQRLRARDPETYAFIWGSRTVLLAIGGFGALALLTVSILFWVSPYALRTFGVGKEEVGLAIGLPTALVAALGLIAGGRLSDLWSQRDPRGRVFVSMLSAVLPVPFVIAMMCTHAFSTFAVLNACAVFMLQLWGASAVSAMQDFVPPRLRGTIMATHGLGATLLGSALGPYFSGKVATITGSLQLGILSLLAICPVALFLLWQVCRRMAPSRDEAPAPQ
jgi:MFS family permease